MTEQFKEIDQKILDLKLLCIWKLVPIQLREYLLNAKIRTIGEVLDLKGLKHIANKQKRLGLNKVLDNFKSRIRQKPEEFYHYYTAHQTTRVIPENYMVVAKQSVLTLFLKVVDEYLTSCNHKSDVNYIRLTYGINTEKKSSIEIAELLGMTLRTYQDYKRDAKFHISKLLQGKTLCNPSIKLNPQLSTVFCNLVDDLTIPTLHSWKSLTQYFETEFHEHFTPEKEKILETLLDILDIKEISKTRNDFTRARLFIADKTYEENAIHVCKQILKILQVSINPLSEQEIVKRLLVKTPKTDVDLIKNVIKILPEIDYYDTDKTLFVIRNSRQHKVHHYAQQILKAEGKPMPVETILKLINEKYSFPGNKTPYTLKDFQLNKDKTLQWTLPQGYLKLSIWDLDFASLQQSIQPILKKCGEITSEPELMHEILKKFPNTHHLILKKMLRSSDLLMVNKSWHITWFNPSYLLPEWRDKYPELKIYDNSIYKSASIPDRYLQIIDRITQIIIASGCGKIDIFEVVDKLISEDNTLNRNDIMSLIMRAEYFKVSTHTDHTSLVEIK